MKQIFLTIFTLTLLAAPRVALACPVCFGNSDAPMAKATNLGIFVMLGVVVCMLAGFAAFFIYVNRRMRLVESPKGTEGVAQC